MIKRLLLPVIFAIIAVGFWVGPSVNEIAAGGVLERLPEATARIP